MRKCGSLLVSDADAAGVTTMDSHSGSTLATAFTLIADQETEQQLPSTQDLRAALEKGTDQLKLETLRRIVVATLNGQPQPNLLMPIIQFVLPSKNKHIKKLLQSVPTPPALFARCSRSFPQFLLGNLSQTRRERQAQTGNDSRLVRTPLRSPCAPLPPTPTRTPPHSHALSTDFRSLPRRSNAIRNDLVR